MIRAAALLLALAAPAAQAQSFEDAVQQNVALAISICAQQISDPPAAMASLQAAGFTYGGAEGPQNDPTHRYLAPAETAEVRIYFGQMAPDCQVETRHLTPAEAGAIVGGVLQGIFPGRFTPAAGACPAFTEITNQIPLTLAVSDLGNGGGCAPGDGARIVIARFV